MSHLIKVTRQITAVKKLGSSDAVAGGNDYNPLAGYGYGSADTIVSIEL